MKVCTKCGIEKDESEFSKDKQKKDGLRPSCISCQKQYYLSVSHEVGFKMKNRQRVKKWHDENKETARRQREESAYVKYTQKNSVCFICGNPISFERFFNAKGKVLYCSDECMSKRHEKYKLLNPDKYKLSQSKQKEKNKIKRKTAPKIIYEKKCPKCGKVFNTTVKNKIYCGRRCVVNVYRKSKYGCDALYKIQHILRTRINQALRKTIKSNTTMKLTGCSLEKLKIHIENKFDTNMSWNNFGKNGWELDHIIPCAAFDLTDPEEQKKCFNYMNLRPAWSNENRAKSDNLDLTLVVKHNIWHLMPEKNPIKIEAEKSMENFLILSNMPAPAEEIKFN